MKDDQSAFFLERYRGMSTEELIELRNADLTAVAKAALDEVMAERGTSEEQAQEIAAQIRREQREAARAYEEQLRVRAEKEKKRDALLFELVLFIAVPLTVLGALLNPDRTYQAFLSALVQGLGLALIVWIVLAAKRFLTRKR
jgi:hypothetical protein